MAATTKRRARFGELAVSRGYVTAGDVDKAVEIQAYRRQKGQDVPLLGSLLETMGRLTRDEVSAVAAACPNPAARRRLAGRQRSSAVQVSALEPRRGGLRGPAPSASPPSAQHETRRLRSDLAQILARVTSLESERVALRARLAAASVELDAVTEAMIAKEDLIDELRETIRRLGPR